MLAEQLSKYLRRFIFIGLYLIPFMPFIFMDGLIFPFITGKIFVFQIIVELIFAAYLILIYFDRNYRPRVAPVLIAVSLFILTAILATIFGIDPDRSFWGNYERMSGLFTILHFFAYFLILTSLLREQKTWLNYLSWALALSGIQAIIGIAQYHSNYLLLTRGGGKIWGTLGNYIYLATYSIIHIFLGLMLLFGKEFNRLVHNYVKNLWRIFVVLVIILNFIALFLTRTRGGYVGFLVGLFLALVMFTLTTKKKKTKFILSGLVILLVGLGLLGRVYRTNELVKNLPIFGPLLNVDIKTDTGFTRLIAWKIAIQGWREKPILGWGPENYYYVFNKYYDPRSLEHGEYETWFDRPHNAVLEALSTQGVLGLLAYLLVFLSIFIFGIRRYRSRQVDAAELFFGLGGLGAYFIQNLFVFDQPSSFLLFYLLLAWFNFSILNNKKLPEEQKISFTKIALPASLIIGVSALALIYVGTLRSWKVAMKTVDAEIALRQNFYKGIELYRQTISMPNIYNDDAQINLAKAITDRLDVKNSNLIKNNLDRLMFTIREIEKNAEKHPQDVLPYILLSQLYSMIAQIDQRYFYLAEEVTKRALSVSPKRQQIYYQLAKLKLMRNDFDGAIATLDKTIDLDPNISESYWYKGIVFNTKDDAGQAAKYFKEARARNYHWKYPGEILLLADVLERAKDFEAIPPLLEELITLDNRAENYLLLAKAYKKIGNLEKYNTARAKVLESNPKILEK